MGLLGIAMSRYSGCWVGMKVITETVETTAEINLNDEMTPFIIPTDFEMPRGRSQPALAGRSLRAGSPAAGLQGLCRDCLRARQQDQPRHHGFAERAVRHHGLRQELRGRAPGAARARHHRAGRGEDRSAALQDRHAVAAGAGRRAQVRGRSRRDLHRRGTPRDRREPGQAGAVQLARRRAPAHRRQDGRHTTSASCRSPKS